MAKIIGITVSGRMGVGKSQVLGVIERALKAEYGDDIDLRMSVPAPSENGEAADPVSAKNTTFYLNENTVY